eukprot:m.32115 g.32115  ORF g.32115 m.32115 type:complete len:467 (+) comp14906_c0_seq1:57-1457(+)
MASKARLLMETVARNGSCTACPAHSLRAVRSCTSHKNAAATKDYAFEMTMSSVRVGPGVTQEIGMDLANMDAKHVCVIADPNLSDKPPVQATIASLERSKVNFKVFDKVRVEPDINSFLAAIDYAKSFDFDAFVAVGGGSTMDTAKAANLYASCPDADFLDFVNAPIGKGLPVPYPPKPLFAIPTTSGTGSETTGVAIFDYPEKNAKTGIAHRFLRPTLGLIDPLHTQSMPANVVAYSGFDVLCHAMESYTALPFNERTPRPENPKYRPAYQGSNPISDIWALHALRICKKYLKRAIADPGDTEARTEMLLASCFAGIGFNNSGIHLCHANSYAVSSQVRSFTAPDYDPDHPLVPHGLAVMITAPSVFRFTAPACPERHLELAAILGKETDRVAKSDAGFLLSDALTELMDDLKVPNGLTALGFSSDDITSLVEGTLPQHRVTKLSPNPVGHEELASIFEGALTVY